MLHRYMDGNFDRYVMTLLVGHMLALLVRNLFVGLLRHFMTDFVWHLVTLFVWHLSRHILAYLLFVTLGISCMVINSAGAFFYIMALLLIHSFIMLLTNSLVIMRTFLFIPHLLHCSVTSMTLLFIMFYTLLVILSIILCLIGSHILIVALRPIVRLV